MKNLCTQHGQARTLSNRAPALDAPKAGAEVAPKAGAEVAPNPPPKGVAGFAAHRYAQGRGNRRKGRGCRGLCGFGGVAQMCEREDMTVSGKYSAAKHQNPYADEPRMLDSALIASCCARNSAISGATTDQAHPE
jgi:hypothetical protein